MFLKFPWHDFINYLLITLVTWWAKRIVHRERSFIKRKLCACVCTRWRPRRVYSISLRTKSASNKREIKCYICMLRCDDRQKSYIQERGQWACSAILISPYCRKGTKPGEQAPNLQIRVSREREMKLYRTHTAAFRYEIKWLMILRQIDIRQIKLKLEQSWSWANVYTLNLPVWFTIKILTRIDAEKLPFTKIYYFSGLLIN